MLTATITSLWHTISPVNTREAEEEAPTYFSDTRTLQSPLICEAGERAELTYRLHSCRAAHHSAPGTAKTTRPVFVLVHGIGMSHRYFDRLRARLLVHGDVVVFDLPGFGGTPTPVRQLTAADYASVIAHALDAAQLTSGVVVGHSMGAQFVTELALQRPDLVSAVVLIGPVTDTAHPSAARNAMTLALDTLVERPVTNLLVGTAYLQCGLRWYRTELPVMLGYRLDHRLAGVTQPVLVLRGSHDPIAGRKWCQRLGAAARDGRVVEVPGQPHAAHRGGAKFVADAILDLIEDLPATPFGVRGGPMNEGSDPLPRHRATGTSSPTSSSRPKGSLAAAEAPRSRTRAQWRGITVADRQCRTYLLEHQDTGQRPMGTGAASTNPVPVFVLVHGIGMSHRYFLRLGHQLSRVGRVLLIDLPGYGWTRRPARGATNSANAELLAALLDQVGVSSCTVVGHSMGVQTATELATRRPDLVSHLVLIGAAVDERRRTIPQQALTLGLNSLLEKPVLNTVQFMDVLRCGPRWYLAELAIAMDYRLEERLPQATQPVLILRGSRDLVAGTRWSRSLADSSKNGVLTVIPGEPHAVHHSSPATVATHIISFITNTRPPHGSDGKTPQLPIPDTTAVDANGGDR